jgi:hypothetical protein
MKKSCFSDFKDKTSESFKYDISIHKRVDYGAGNIIAERINPLQFSE